MAAKVIKLNILDISNSCTPCINLYSFKHPFTLYHLYIIDNLEAPNSVAWYVHVIYILHLLWYNYYYHERYLSVWVEMTTSFPGSSLFLYKRLWLQLIMGLNTKLFPQLGYTRSIVFFARAGQRFFSRYVNKRNTRVPWITCDKLLDSPSKLSCICSWNKRRIWHYIKSHILCFITWNLVYAILSVTAL